MDKNNSNQKLAGFADDQLVEMFRDGGKAAVAASNELIGRHQTGLFRRCRARLGNHVDAEEAVQETLLRAYRGMSRFRGKACFRTWLFSIGDNQCNTLYIRRSARLLSDHVRALIELQQESHHHDHLAEDAELVSAVREVLNEMPRAASDVLELRFYRDLSIEDIATTLGIGLSAAKMRMYRAMTQFESLFTATGRELAA